MNELKNSIKVTSQFLFVIILIFFSTANAKGIDKFNKATNIADYFSGIVLLNQNQYEESQKYLKKLHGLEKKHTTYSSKYLYSLINSGNFNFFCWPIFVNYTYTKFYQFMTITFSSFFF